MNQSSSCGGNGTGGQQQWPQGSRPEQQACPCRTCQVRFAPGKELELQAGAGGAGKVNGAVARGIQRPKQAVPSASDRGERAGWRASPPCMPHTHAISGSRPCSPLHG